MSERILINSDEYKGKYVAFKSYDDNTVISSGEDPEKVLKLANLEGYSRPLLAYITDKEIVNIFYAN